MVEWRVAARMKGAFFLVALRPAAPLAARRAGEEQGTAMESTTY